MAEGLWHGVDGGYPFTICHQPLAIRYWCAVGAADVRRANEIAVRLMGMHEQIRIRGQSVSQMNAGQRRTSAEMKRYSLLARLKKSKLAWPDDAGIKTAGHGC